MTNTAQSTKIKKAVELTVDVLNSTDPNPHRRGKVLIFRPSVRINDITCISLERSLGAGQKAEKLDGRVGAENRHKITGLLRMRARLPKS